MKFEVNLNKHYTIKDAKNETEATQKALEKFENDGQTLNAQVIQLLSYEELPEDAKQKVLEELWNINVDFEWWDFLYDDFQEELEKIGVSCKTFYFSLDRNYHIFMDEPHITNEHKFLHFCGFKDLRKKEAREYLSGYGLYIDTNRNKNYVTYGFIGYEAIELTERLNDKLNEFLKKLQEEYDYQISEEAIIETIKANEYQFTKEGKIF